MLIWFVAIYICAGCGISTYVTACEALEIDSYMFIVLLFLVLALLWPLIAFLMCADLYVDLKREPF
jgi:hypothetical protein